ncbi:YY1-associated factor 2-like isoform X1 [Dendronephthya gigantea]|uniref:YY1-associated factor 2-like isoform X1 n=1 Tax=Dendronephthya gigantea TaxID=151771 RepID=UPI00106D1532|nr:YY1-associated factor 2-like isoform X1 [Dendronephthya gigantea]
METNSNISNSNSQIDNGDILEEPYWDCSVCTYKNNPESFKCRMCDVRKGTSTRKPRLNQQIVAQQVVQKFSPATVNGKKLNGKKMPRKIRPRLKNVDRSSAQELSVTVGNITVTITDYKLLPDNTLSAISDSLSHSTSSESLDSSGVSSEQVAESNGSKRNGTMSLET